MPGPPSRQLDITGVLTDRETEAQGSSHWLKVTRLMGLGGGMSGFPGS